jgi:uncharacterized membrane protein
VDSNGHGWLIRHWCLLPLLRVINLLALVLMVIHITHITRDASKNKTKKDEIACQQHLSVGQ